MNRFESSSQRARHEPHSVQSAKIASAINIVFGVWLIVVPFVFRYTDLIAPTWNDIIIGLVVLTVACIRIADVVKMFELGWINFVAGIWLLASPWIFHYTTHIAPLWNDLSLGIMILVVAAAGLFARPHPRVMG